MIPSKVYNLTQTSKQTAEIGDVILKSRNSKNLLTRQVLSAKVVENKVDPGCPLSISLIHQKAKDKKFNEDYQDLRSIEPGTSVCIKLDTLQTKQLHNLLVEYYGISEKGVQNGKFYLIESPDDINNLQFADNENKVKLMEKIYSELDDIAIKKLSENPTIIKNIFSNLPKIKIEMLEKLREELNNKLTDNEKTIQSWIDEEPKIRCLIFGLEFIDYKREVQFGNSRFDVLTEQSDSEHVIIEMKSPNCDVFKEKRSQLKHGTKTDYFISEDLAEAIPQTIKYFREYENSNHETMRKAGITQKIPHKALIIIGRKKDDPIWQEHFSDLNNRISGIEILTYDHLMDKMKNQIDNLKKLQS